MSLYNILSVGDPPVELLKKLSEALSSTLSAEIRLTRTALDPEFAFLPERGQYHSTLILKRIDEMFSEFRGRVLGVIPHDLCIPILTFVFGEAQLMGRAAVISLKRLKQEFYGLAPDEDLFFERTVKEALHEIGHTFGLKHCDDWDCVMHTSNTVEEIDIKSARFCDNCSGFLY